MIAFPPRRRILLLVGCLVVALLTLICFARLKNLAGGLYARATNATVADRMAQYGVAARARLRPDFLRVGCSYPPAALRLVALKEEKRLELWALPGGESANRGTVPPAAAWKKIHTWPILASTGHAGPKLRAGDGQTPEGFYRIESLNPTSLYHLALRVNYPNAEDRSHATADGRPAGSLGGDIMIHGMNVSIGCLAIGDPGIEELFVLAADVGVEHMDLWIAPCDLRVKPPPALGGAGQGWEPELYSRLATALRNMRAP